MTDQIGKYLGLPPLHADKVEEDRNKEANAISKKLEKNIPKPVVDVRPQVMSPLTRDEEAEVDFDYARGNMYNVIETGTKALEELLDVATQSQHPRAYEVLATTMKTLVDANKQLVDLSKEKAAESKPKTDDGSGGNVTNNNLFVGTTHDLLKVLAGMKKNNDPN